MATYIQGVTDVFPQFTPFQPDLNLVQKALGTLQARYDQGFASVKNAYNQVLNSDLTNSKLKMQRDEYVKQAEKQLKDLSSVDLSIPENQVTAESVFTPFWDDDRMLFAMQRTKDARSQMARGNAVRDSMDEKVREQYNDITMRYLQNGLEDLRDTDPDSPDFFKIEQRRWVPFKNLEKYLNEQAKLVDLKIEWKSENGPYLVNMRNGPRAIKSFRTWATDTVGNNFVEQFQVIGAVERDEGVKMIMRNNPTVTKQQAIEMLADNTLSGIVRGYEKQEDSYNSDLARVRSKIKWYDDSNTPTTVEEEMYGRELFQQEEELMNSRDETREAREKYIKNYDRTRSDFMASPVNFYATLNKQRVMDGWSTGYATGTQSKSMEFNPAVREANDNRHWQEDYNLRLRDLELKDWVAKNPRRSRRGRSSGNSDGSGDYGDDNYDDDSNDNELSGEYLGIGSTDVTKVGEAYDILMEKLHNKWVTAHDNFFGAGKMGLILQKAISLDGEKNMNRGESVKFFSLLKDWMDNPNSDMVNKNAEWFNKVLGKIGEESGIKITGPGNTRNALIALTGKYLTEKRSAMQLDDDDNTIITSYGDGITALEDFNALERRRNEEVQKNIISQRDKFNPIINVKSDGTYDIVTADDAAKDFRAAKVFDRNNVERMLSPKEIAAAYLSGDFNAGAKQIKIGGIDYTFVSRPNSLYYPAQDPLSPFSGIDTDPIDRVALNLNAIEAKYGTSETQKKLRKELNTQVVANMPEYQSETGKYGSEMHYNLNKNKTRSGNPEYGVRLLTEASNPDNRLNIYIASGPEEEFEASKDSDVNDAIIKMMKQGDGKVEDYISGVDLITIGHTGKPMLRLILNPAGADKTIGKVKLESLQKKEIMIEINPNASGPTLSSIRYGTQQYVYDRLLRGESMKSDEVLEAAGFHYEIVPDDIRHPTSAHVEIQRTVFDEKTGKDIKMPVMEEDFLFNRTSPDELKARIDEMFRDHLLNYQTAKYQYERAQSSNPNRRPTGKELVEKYRKNRMR